jgi:hypothetical protein
LPVVIQAVIVCEIPNAKVYTVTVCKIPNEKASILFFKSKFNKKLQDKEKGKILQLIC